jgi:argininosuccinate lyase
MKLWQKTGTKMHPAVNKYIISRNLAADNALLPYDIQGSIAQAKMLGKIKILTETEVTKLVQTLEEIKEKHANGEFVLEQKNEDVHTAIENYLVEKLGDTGKKIHSGRSRNDQILTDQRLQAKDQLQVTAELCLKLAQKLIEFATEHKDVPMPGYTHTQIAMPSSVGQWASSFAESLINDVYALQGAHKVINQNPLGTAAGFGSGLPLDRDHTTKTLGFGRVQINPIYAQNSRGKLEAFVVSSLFQVMMSLGKLANDLVWFTSGEIKFFDVNPSPTTGSSIMPQKRNLDIMEVLRANVSIVQANLLQIQTAGMNLISGYNKDLKITKKPVIESFDLTNRSLEITHLLFENMVPNEDRLRASFDTSIFATDEVNKMVMNGVPFRDAYREVGTNLDKIKAYDIDANLKSKTHLGSTGNLGLEIMTQRLEDLKKIQW